MAQRKGTPFRHLAGRAAAGRGLVRDAGVDDLVYLAPNSTAFPVALFAAAAAGVPLVPINYRLELEQLEPLLDAHRSSVVIVEDDAGLREQLMLVLKSARDIECLYAVGSGEEAREELVLEHQHGPGPRRDGVHPQVGARGRRCIRAPAGPRAGRRGRG